MNRPRIVTVAIVAVALIAVGAAATDPGPASAGGLCVKYEGPSPVGSITNAGKAVTLTIAGAASLTIKGGSEHNGGGTVTYPNPSPGVPYFAPMNPQSGDNFEVSHWIVCTPPATSTTPPATKPPSTPPPTTEPPATSSTFPLEPPTSETVPTTPPAEEPEIPDTFPPEPNTTPTTVHVDTPPTLECLPDGTLRVVNPSPHRADLRAVYSGEPYEPPSIWYIEPGETSTFTPIRWPAEARLTIVLSDFTTEQTCAPASTAPPPASPTGTPAPPAVGLTLPETL